MTGIAHGIEAMNNEIKRLQSINAELVEALEGLYNYEKDNLTSKYSYEEAMLKAKQALKKSKGET